MPGIRDGSSADRALGQRLNMHPRRGGDLILQPDDILEGIGDFIEYDADGNPVGWRLGQLEVPDGRNVYVGRTPDTTVKVTPRPLTYDRPSHLVNYDLPTVGQPPPNPNSPGLAQIPRPPAPTLRALAAAVEGYDASTPARPHWYAIAYVRNGTILTGYGPPVSFQLAFGQSVRVPLPDRSTLPEGIFQVALLMAEPGTSTAAAPGPMRVQRIVDLRFWNLPYYELTGPFRSDGLPASRTNGTTLPTAPAPGISRDHSNYGARCATYTAKIIWTDDNGETLEGAPSASVTIGQSSRYTIMAPEETLVYKPGAGYVPAEKNTIAFRAGEGRVTIKRPPPPVGATGWKALLYIQPIFADADFEAGWRYVVSRFSQKGDALPFPLSVPSVSTAGWEGSEEHYAMNDTYVCVQASLPPANTTGVPAPEDQLPQPEPTSASRPEPGDLWVRVTDTVRGRESLASPARKIVLESDTLASVVFVDPSNRLPNPSFVETDPKGDPLYWTITRTGGLARVEASPTDTDGQQLVIETESPQTGTTPSATSDSRDLDDNTTPDYIDVSFDVEPPVSGVPAGTFDIQLVEELSNGGTQTRNLATRSSVGEYAETFEIKGSGDATPGTFRWHILTLKWKLRFSFGGATKNLRARIRHSRHRHERHKRRLDRRRRKPPRQNPRPGRPPAKVQDPPEPPWSPETFSVPWPDRPLDYGTLMQSLPFDTEMPPGFAVDVKGNGSAVRTPDAALFGTANGLRLSSGAAGTDSAAAIKKRFTPAAAGFAYRHAIGSYIRNRFATLPTGGSIRMHEVKSPSLQSIAWLEMSTQLEKVLLSIDAQPTTPGNASITLDTTSHNLTVQGAQEVQDVAVDTAPSAIGTMSVGPQGANLVVEPGGNKHAFNVNVGSAPGNGNDIYITVNGRTHQIGIVAADTRMGVCNKIANVAYPDYDAVAYQYFVRFTSKQAGTRPNPAVNANGGGTALSWTHVATGSYETREALASRLATLSYPGWTAAASPAGAHVVRYTKIAAGAVAPAAISAGTTKAVLTASTITEGFVDTRQQFAARIAAMTFPGWTQAVDPTNTARVIFTATTAGVRQKSSYRPVSTGATGTISTLIQGSNGDLTAHARDADGTVQRRKIISSISAGLIFNTDITVSGAGTDRAVVAVWGSLNSDGSRLLARFEDVDLTGISAELVHFGITSESDPSITWTLDCDAGQVNDRGRFFHRDHTATGLWAPQAFLYTDKGQPLRQDLFLQDARAAVLPGETYTLSLFARADIQDPTPAKLLKITGLVSGLKAGATGSTRDLGDATDNVTDGVGLKDKTGWTKYEKTFTVPGDVFEVVLNSRDIGSAEIVVQEVVMSPGQTGLRTGLYATSGEYIATFDLRTPRTRPHLKPWGQERISFGATVDEPLASTTMTRAFRSAPASTVDPSIPDQAVWTTYTPNGSEVPDQDFVQAKFIATGPGNATPALKAGSPYCEYLLKLGPRRRVSTLLKEDRSEFPGGVTFAEVHEWTKRKPDGRRRLPSGRFHDEPELFPAFGHFPPCKIMVYDQETKAHIDENWKDLYVAEVFGQDAITIKLGSQPEWTKESKSINESPSGHRQTIWTAQLPASEVVQAVPLPRPGAVL